MTIPPSLLEIDWTWQSPQHAQGGRVRTVCVGMEGEELLILPHAPEHESPSHGQM